MADWLVLLNDEVAVEETVTALRAAIPPPWGHIVVLQVAQRWWPLSSGVPLAYRAERQRALREVWAEQEASARARLAEVAEAVKGDAAAVDVQLAWGDPVAEAHQLARARGAAMIVVRVPAGAGIPRKWPGDVARRLTRDAPCSVLLACAPGGHGRVGYGAAGATSSIRLRTAPR